MGEKKKVYILVKTYPTISREYSELVCTAGLQEDGTWIRLYPVPFRKLDIDQKYPKYTWIELEVDRNTKDFRPETYRPRLDTIQVSPKSKRVDWDQRRRIILKKTKVYTDLTELIADARTKSTSLAIFKPTKVISFSAKECEQRDWDPDKVAILEALSKQQSFFQTPEELENEFKLVKKVPYKFYYTFEDCNGKQSQMMIEDWEIGMLFFHCLDSASGNEQEAIKKVKEKYFDYFAKSCDLYFFLGTTLKHHNTAKNPFVIIGEFHPPMQQFEQTSMFEDMDGTI